MRRSWEWLVIAGLCAGLSGPALGKDRHKAKRQEPATTCEQDCETDLNECSGICKEVPGPGAARCASACRDGAKECVKSCQEPEPERRER